MSEIQFIIHLMMKYDLPEEVKVVCLERIGEVEGKLTAIPAMNPYHNVAPPKPPGSPYPLSQAQIADSIAPTSVAMVPINQPDQIITGGGNGTSIRGPNKFKRHAIP